MKTAFRLSALLFALGLAGALCGCTAMQVVSLPNRDVAALSADDVAKVMLRAGFSETEIVEHGPALRNSLALHGAARVYRDNQTLALFSVYQPYLHVSSQRRGAFLYDLERGEFR